jgi:hypothetical protein
MDQRAHEEHDHRRQQDREPERQERNHINLLTSNERTISSVRFHAGPSRTIGGRLEAVHVFLGEEGAVHVFWLEAPRAAAFT